MANLNKVMLIGRLTRDPETRTFANGGKVTKLGFAVNNRKKNQQTGQWEDEPVWLDVEAFNRGEFGKLADRVEQYLTKGQQIFIEGHLRLDQWTAQDGQKRQKLVIVMDSFEFLSPRGEGQPGGMGRQQGDSQYRQDNGGEMRPPARSAPPAYEESPPFNDAAELPEHPPGKEIPF
jgi:single-strand DNA-binding protein